MVSNSQLSVKSSGEISSHMYITGGAPFFSHLADGDNRIVINRAERHARVIN
ncbi:hypothetical protein [Enterobacter sp. Bisph1]|uniref:hypothetical protein n=1 Tax=Enterobacter sp. Bisph1 TaxID=1274399 RepID=UPI0018CD2F5C|nr:hypothetical protein [Enterobacter sp. Bisph1]